MKLWFQKPSAPTLFKFYLLVCLVGIVGGAIATVFFFQNYSQKIYPGIVVDGTNVGGLTQAQGINLLLPHQDLEEDSEVILQHQDAQISSSAAELRIHKNISLALSQAYEIGRHGSWYQRLNTILNIQKHGLEIETQLTFDKDRVAEMVMAFKTQIDQPPQLPEAQLTTSGNADSLTITSGENGVAIDVDATVDRVLVSANTLPHQASAVVLMDQVKLTSDQQTNLGKNIAQHLIGKKLVFNYDYHVFIINDKTLISLLKLPSGIKVEQLNSLLDDWAVVVNQEPQQAVFEYDANTLVVKKFEPAIDGIALDREKTIQTTSDWTNSQLNQPAPTTDTTTEADATTTLDLPVVQTQTQNTLAETNNLGINERIGFGESRYDHSITTRIHNVALTTSRINNTLVAPGVEFSFNKTLGDVSSLTGFKPAYVIKDGMTVLGDGGGVCQVSSTLFRALLDSGLKITLRIPHSYRVSYYELNSDPGFDATVYAGNTDLRFVNDTSHYILIRGVADSQNLYMKMEIYGTNDGRTTEVSNYKKWDYSPPLPTEYIPDPSLSPGQLKQIDWPAAGIKAQFVHTVRNKDGEIMSQKTYTSNYRPWSAKYLQGV